jgi:hypothetical protein
MSSVQSAKISVHLYDVNGVEVYKTTGVASGKWTQNNITAPGDSQWLDKNHTNAVQLDNGDRMMIVGKQVNNVGWGWSAYRSYNIIINAGCKTSLLNSCTHPRRMVIARTTSKVPGWTAPDNLISFSSAGFTQTSSGNWPKFTGKFRVYYQPL